MRGVVGVTVPADRQELPLPGKARGTPALEMVMRRARICACCGETGFYWPAATALVLLHPVHDPARLSYVPLRAQEQGDTLKKNNKLMQCIQYAELTELTPEIINENL